MFGLFAEGLETAFFPCSLVLAVPSVAMLLASRRHSAAGMGMFVIGLLISSWLRFAGLIDVWPAVLTAAALIGSGIALLKPFQNREASSAGAAGVVAGAATGSLWRPCVGFEFGELLTSFNDISFASTYQLTVYVIGVMAPILALTAIANALPQSWLERAKKPMVWTGVGILGLLGLAVLFGLDDRVITQLFLLSSF